MGKRAATWAAVVGLAGAGGCRTGEKEWRVPPRRPAEALPVGLSTPPAASPAAAGMADGPPPAGAATAAAVTLPGLSSPSVGVLTGPDAMREMSARATQVASTNVEIVNGKSTLRFKYRDGSSAEFVDGVGGRFRHAALYDTPVSAAVSSRTSLTIDQETVGRTDDGRPVTTRVKLHLPGGDGGTAEPDR